MLLTIFNKTRQRDRLIARMHQQLGDLPESYLMYKAFGDAITPLRTYGQHNIQDRDAVRQALLNLPPFLANQYGTGQKTAQAMFNLVKTLRLDEPERGTDSWLADQTVLYKVIEDLEQKSAPFFKNAFSNADTRKFIDWIDEWEKFGGCSEAISEELLNNASRMPVYLQLKSYDLITTRGTYDQRERAISKVRALMPVIQNEHPVHRARMMLEAQELCLRTFNHDLREQFEQKIMQNTL